MTSADVASLGERGQIEAWARTITRWSVALIVFVSMGVFSPALVPEQQAQLQQVAALGLWMLVIAASFLITPVVRLELTADVVALAAFYGFAILSACWSDLTAPTFMKAAALAITTFAAYRLATRLDIDDILGATTFALFLLIASSIFTALFIPRIGVDDSWMHNGQWQGIFASKQALGIFAAHLLLFATYRKINGGGWIEFVVVAGAAAAAVVGAGSRGGGALAVAACVALYLCARSTLPMKLIAIGPLLLSAFACLMILYLYSTGYDSFHVGNTTVDFTERSFIWQFAISHFNDAPLFGYGLNGFWTIKQFYDYFEQSHGWVLDNFHSGYLAILIETGLIGFALFLTATVLIVTRALLVIRHRTMFRQHCTLAIVFILLSYQINLTETNFLRSTSFLSILLIVVQLTLCGAPATTGRPGEGRSS
ncbi:O-antigen ligase [Rhodopseudomonas sp. B29]|uniref:O-antigen ligase family protein n=1 Tax=Rhodopseudomonas sp. B29 TaxID=95607 RepID=UPI0003462BC8|nr:O-antigen ligase family protein [Rhodopseudomonas sp. B29]